MDIFQEFISVPAIVVICYLIAEAVKVIADGKLNKFLPIICGACGAVLSTVAFLLIPDCIAADNILVAVAIGIVSGLSATGINQIFKQIKN